MCFDTVDDGGNLSDHFPVFCYLKVTPRLLSDTSCPSKETECGRFYRDRWDKDCVDVWTIIKNRVFSTWSIL